MKPNKLVRFLPVAVALLVSASLLGGACATSDSPRGTERPPDIASLAGSWWHKPVAARTLDSGDLLCLYSNGRYVYIGERPDMRGDRRTTGTFLVGDRELVLVPSRGESQRFELRYDGIALTLTDDSGRQRRFDHEPARRCD